MDNCTKELIVKTALAALEDKAYQLHLRLGKGRTTRVGKLAQPISHKEQQEVIDGIYRICDRIEGGSI